MGAQLRTFQCVTAPKFDLKVKALYWFQCTQTDHRRPRFLARVVQICILLVLSRNDLSEKNYTVAHLQSSSYKSLVKLTLIICYP